MDLREEFKKLLQKLNHEAKLEAEATEQPQEVEKVELATMSLADGTTVEAESFEAGNGIAVLTAEGERMPLPVGEYQLEGGMVLVVEVEGVIASISEGEMEAPEAPEQDLNAELKAENDTLKAELSELKTKLEKLELAKVEVESKLNSTVDELVKLSEMPADSGIKPNPSGKQSSEVKSVNLSKMTIEQRIEHFKNLSK